jgi:hypothetical protein
MSPQSVISEGIRADKRASLLQTDFEVSRVSHEVIVRINRG